ncbi:MAG: diphosphate--fructose-6-phosphate 1-phosphotransferase [Elusimicrobiota bacterium]|jgi:pyrophosphate--fructose-6-phosphate 1-phosphotransferase|nr:diphosphate--fructose-6-phosphate 1-phosphotransferase [Elusimicrobiota bacterium]
MSRIQCSEIQIERRKFKPQLPDTLKSDPANIKIKRGSATNSISNQEELKAIFPNTYGLPLVELVKGKNLEIKKKQLKVGVVLSGGQAPGGHNVIAGIFDCLKKANAKNSLIGFSGGPSGILENKYKVITEKTLHDYRNTGGFDFIQSGRTKIETPEQFEKVKNNLIENKLNALVIIGGDDSNTNAAFLAEFMRANNIDCNVIGVPKTIDGDLKNKYIETSFGFDTATKIYAELAGNICRDAYSSRKYWHFIRLMGRSASHITLEVGFKTQPNIVLIGEEISAKKMTLAQVVDSIADIIVRRSKEGKKYGIVLVPEGLIEFIPEIKELISALNDALASANFPNDFSIEQKKNFLYEKLPSNLSNLLKSIPSQIASQLLLDRDPHGNVLVSQIETEKLLIEMTHKKLAQLKKENLYDDKFAAITHFFGYEGRCGIPTNFDANYTYTLGYNAAILALNGLTSYISSIRNLVKPPKQWICGGVPITMMMNIERRKGHNRPVIQKTLVDLNGKPFKQFQKVKDKWAIEECYLFPGPIQYFGDSFITDMTTKTLKYEQK